MPRAFSFKINLRDVAPRGDPLWENADTKTRAEVLNWLVIYGLKEKDAELAAGLDRRGVPLAPIAASTRKHRKSEMGPADPNAPPLMPAYAVSRTRLLLQGRAVRDGAEFSWETDPISGKNWGIILGYHRRGRGRHGHRIPKRDVIGISPQALQRVRSDITTRWSTWKMFGGKIPERMMPVVPPPRYAVTGRTDYGSFTFAASGQKEAEAALARGYATGFRQRAPGTGGAAFGGPPAPTPPTKPKIPGLAEAMRLVEEERAYTVGFKVKPSKPRITIAPPAPKPKPIPPSTPPKPKGGEVIPPKPTAKPKPPPLAKPILKPVVPKPIPAPKAKPTVKPMPGPAKIPAAKPAEAFREIPPADTIKWIEQNFGKWRKSLKADELHAWDRYVGDNFETINEVLRGNLRSELIKPESYEKVIRDLRASIAKTELKENVTLWRTTGEYRFGVTDPKQLIGTVIEDKAFVSTTIDKNRVDISGLFHRGFVMEIKAPKGLKAGAAFTQADKVTSEYEVLLQAGTKFRVTGHREEQTRDILIVEAFQ